MTPDAHRDIRMLAVQALAVALVAGWFATDHASAPDDGLLQLDLLSLSERVPGAVAVDGRPTMLVLTCPAPYCRCRSVGSTRRTAWSSVPTRPSRAGLALPLATAQCQPGYVLLDADSVIRYRS
jgi:hypothetical protein